MDMPPTRYKVVEQGRRLVVIDTWNGDAPATRQAPRSEAPVRSATPQQARAALRPARRERTGTGVDTPDTVITTQPWFDAKAPRRVKLDGSAHGMLLVALAVGAMAAILIFMMWGWLVFLVLGFILAQKQVRGAVRTGVTAWLDTQQSG